MGPAERSGVGIIGAGRLGQAMARTALRAGRLTEMATTTLVPITGTAGACRATGQPRASWYRAHRQSPPPPRPPRPTPRLQPRALGASERQQALEVLHDERCWDAAPASVSATLLDEGSYLCSVSTMYRLLRSVGETGDRRRHATHPPRVKPAVPPSLEIKHWLKRYVADEVYALLCEPGHQQSQHPPAACISTAISASRRRHGGRTVAAVTAGRSADPDGWGAAPGAPRGWCLSSDELASSVRLLRDVLAAHWELGCRPGARGCPQGRPYDLVRDRERGALS